ncbi:uncharacterized protein LOC111046387 [Nilaparvata lugens]|uniref:uncharacterized protein LOC111046387 n=1 Tax=Nilaparvata lugens TaxID=108931 RepID=UPI00193E476B|nr:uncharacterized protein LOC111046387 [Nilaparvata lugens]
MTTEKVARSYPPEEMCNRNANMASRSTREMFGQMRQSSRQQCSPGMVTTPQKHHRRPCPVHPSRRVRAPSLPRELKIAKSKCPSDQDFTGLARQLQGLFPKGENQQPLEMQKIPKSTGQKYSTDKRELKNAEMGEEYNPEGVCDLKKIPAGEQVTRESETSGKRRSSSLPKNPRRLSTMDSNQYEPYATNNQQTQTKPINILPIQNEQIGYQQEEIYDENIIPSEADKQENNYLPTQKNIYTSQFMNIPPRSRPECEFMSNPPRKRPEYVSIPAQSRPEFMNIPPRNRRESQNLSFSPRNRPESEYINIPLGNRPDPEFIKITPQRGPATNFRSIPPQRRPESNYMNIPPQKRLESETVNMLPNNETLEFCGKPICEQRKVSMRQDYGGKGNANSKTCQELKNKCGCPITTSEDEQKEGNSKNVNFVKENEDSKNDQYYDFESTNNVNSRNEDCYEFEGENEYSKADFENENFNSRIYEPYNFVDRNEDSRIGYQYHNFENRHVNPRIPQVTSDYFGNNNRDPRMQQKPLNVRGRREYFRNDRYHNSENKPVDPRMQSQSFHFGGRNQNIDQCHDFGNNDVDPRFRHQFPRDRVEDNCHNTVNPGVRQSPSFPDRNEDYDAVQCHDFQEDNVDPRNQQYSNLENENGNSIRNDQCNYSENNNLDSTACQFKNPVNETENSKAVQYKDIRENNAKASLDECRDTQDKNCAEFEEPGRVATKQTESNKEAERYADCSPEINPVCQQETPDIICQSENKPCPTEKVTGSDAQAIHSNSNKSWKPKMNVCVKLVRNRNGELVMVKDDKCACCNHK